MSIYCYTPCSQDKMDAGNCPCQNRVDFLKTIEGDPKICPNCGNDKLVDIAEELDGGYKCIDCGIRFKENGK